MTTKIAQTVAQPTFSRLKFHPKQKIAEQFRLNGELCPIWSPFHPVFCYKDRALELIL
jgi:hypothetical protein